MPKDDELIYTIADVSYEKGMNTFEFLANTGYYTVSPRPEACTTLYTNFNIQTSGVVIGENIESHVFVLNSLGNTVDIAVNQISALQNYCAKLEKEINDMKNKTNWFDVVMDVVQISNFCFNFGGLMKVGAEGIFGALKLAFSKNAGSTVKEVAYVDEIIDDGLVLAPHEVVEEKPYVETEIIIPDERLCFKYYCEHIETNYKIDVSFMVDDIGEMYRIYEYEYKENGSIECLNSDVTDISAINCELVYEFPYLLIYGTIQPSFVKLKYTPAAKNDNELLLGETLTNNQLLTASATKKLIENHKNHLNESFTNKLSETLNNYATVRYVQDNYPSYTYLNTNFKNNNQLTNILNAYALKTDMTHAIEQVKSEIPEIIEGQTTIQFKIENNTIPDLDYDTYHEMIEQYGLDIVSSNNYYTAHYVHVDYSYDNDQPSQIMRMEGSGSSLWFLYDCHELINPGTGETPEILSCSITKNIEPTDKNAYSARYVSNTFALKTDIPEPVDLSNYALKSDYDELKAKIENLQTENTNLKATIEAMESRLTALENGS